MEQQNEQLQGKTSRSPLSILIPVCILLAGLLLWFFLYERPHQNALSQFRAAAAEYDWRTLAERLVEFYAEI